MALGDALELIGLEPGSTDEFKTATGVTIVSTGQRSGEYALETDANSDSFEWAQSSSSLAGIRLWVKGPFGAAGNLISFRDSSDVVLVRIDMTASDELTIGVGGSGTSTATLNADEWNEISVRVLRGSGSNGTINVRINGSEETLDTAGTWSADSVLNFLIESPWSGTHTWDDITSTDNNQFPVANAKIIALRANGLTGGEDDFTIVGGDTNKWEPIDNVVSDDTKYLEFTAADAANQEFDLTTVTVDAISAIKLAGRFRRSGGGATDMRVRSQDSDESSAHILGAIPSSANTWEYMEGSAEESTAFSPIDQTELDRWQAKIIKGAGGRDMDVSEYLFNLEYTEPAAAKFQPSDHFHRHYSPLIAQ